MLRLMTLSCVSGGLLLPFLLRFRYLFMLSAKNPVFLYLPVRRNRTLNFLKCSDWENPHLFSA
jgi:hypothetical protein